MAPEPWPSPGAERYEPPSQRTEVDPGITEALGDDTWKVPDHVEWFYIQVPDDIYAHIRCLTKREVRKKARAERRRTMPLAKRRRRARFGNAIALLVTILVIGGIMKMPDPPPWVHHPEPAPAKVINP